MRAPVRCIRCSVWILQKFCEQTATFVYIHIQMIVTDSNKLWTHFVCKFFVIIGILNIDKVMTKTIKGIYVHSTLFDHYSQVKQHLFGAFGFQQFANLTEMRDLSIICLVTFDTGRIACCTCVHNNHWSRRRHHRLILSILQIFNPFSPFTQCCGFWDTPHTTICYSMHASGIASRGRWFPWAK